MIAAADVARLGDSLVTREPTEIQTKLLIGFFSLEEKRVALR
jgi:hypothetical protein